MELLAPADGGCFVDCTVGLGGHAVGLLERAPEATLVGIDRDGQALELAAERLGAFGDRVRLVQGRFADLDRHLDALGLGRVRGVLADFGVSSLQLDRGERGFSIRHDGPLDMRMGAGELTARDIVNEYPEEDVARILREFGEERQARRVARAIVEERRERPFETTADLRTVVEKAKPVPPGGRRPWTSAGKGQRPTRIHPATQTFQALRIAVNEELDEVEALVEQAARRLEKEGRLVLISYHSGEDRIVKHSLRRLADGEVDPVTGRRYSETQLIELLTRKPLRPSEREVAENPRARSARLRAARRL